MGNGDIDMIKLIGSFETYTTGKPTGYPENVSFARCAGGVDWYDYVRALDIGPTYVQIKNGHVVAITDDASRLFPADSTVVVTDERVDRGWTYDGMSFAPPVAQPAPAIQAAAASLPADVKEIIIGLAETVSAMQQRSTLDAAGHAARIADLEAEIQGLKGVVR